MVVRHGRLVLDAYFEPYREEHRHIIYSATKSITAMLVGIAVADGLIRGDTQPVLDLFPGYRNKVEAFDDRKQALELRHLLTMSAGFDWQDGPYGVRESGDFSRLLAASDGVEYILDKDVVFRTDDVADQQQRVELSFGLDGQSRSTIIEHDEVGTIPVSARGEWEGECRLVLSVVTGWAIPQTWTADFCESDSMSLAIESAFYSTTISARLAAE